MKVEDLKDIPVYEPFVSVIIPTWRHSLVLKRCLNSLENLDYPSDKIEIILIAKGDLAFQAQSRFHLTILKVDSRLNHAQMRNEAVKSSKDGIIVFIDDDVFVKPDWLRNGLRYFLLPKIGCIGGPGVAPSNKSFAESCSYYTLASSFSSGFTFMRYFNVGTMYETGENDLILCNNMIRKNIFIDIGGFHPTLVPCEENDLYRRIIKAGWKLLYVSDIAVEHSLKPPSVLIRKAYWYGIGRGSFIVKNPECNRKPRYFIPSVSLCLICALALSSIFWSLARWILVLCFGLYSLNMAQHLIFVFRRFSRNPVLWITLPPITFLFQHAYGLGVLVGIFNSVFLKKRESKMAEFFKDF